MGNESDGIEALSKRLPASSADEDVQYRRYVLEKVLVGLVSAETQPTFTQKKAEARLQTWFMPVAPGGVSPNLSS